MEESNNKLEFFSDLRDKFFLILGGIVSLATVIPAFLNKTSEIFGLNQICVGYYIFVAVYFVVPYVFYLAYCGIHDDVGYLQLLPTKQTDFLKANWWLKVAMELVLPLVAFFYLIIPCQFSIVSGSVIFFVIAVLCFAWFVIIYWKDEKLRSEVLGIGAVTIAIFGFFFINIIKKEWPKKDGIFSYTSSMQEGAFKAYESSEALKKNFIVPLDSIKQISFNNYAKAILNIKKQEVVTTKIITYDKDDLKDIAAINKAISNIDTISNPTKEEIIKQVNLIKNSSKSLFQRENYLISSSDKFKFYEAVFIQRYFLSLFDRALGIQKIKIQQISVKWAGLLKGLQFKSLIWLLFLIILGLCLWFKTMVKIQWITNQKDSRLPLLKDNASQVKSLIFLLVVLIIPWFRTIDSDSVELDKPFLNFSLSKLSNGSYESQPVILPQPAPPGNPPIYNDSTTLVRIDTNVLISKKLIKEQARRTIGSAEDRKYFNN
jgi:hypothetical protein